MPIRKCVHVPLYVWKRIIEALEEAEIKGCDKASSIVNRIKAMEMEAEVAEEERDKWRW